MIVDSLSRGIVIDHIRSGRALKILEYLKIDPEKDTVALIINAVSRKNGRKDIIKIENVVDLDMDVLGLIEPGATVNIIEDGEIKRKINVSLPEKVENVIQCKNPRCVTSVERAVPHIFTLIDEEKHEYKCIYCDEIVVI